MVGCVWAWIKSFPTAPHSGESPVFKDETKDDIINGFISNSLSVASIENSKEEE